MGISTSWRDSADKSAAGAINRPLRFTRKDAEISRQRTASRTNLASTLGKGICSHVCTKNSWALEACWRWFLAQSLLVSHLQHGEGGRNAAKENQHKTEDLK